MKAIEALRLELYKTQSVMDEFVDDNGVVQVWNRYRYAMLAQRAESIRSSIEWMEALEGGDDVKS